MMNAVSLVAVISPNGSWLWLLVPPPRSIFFFFFFTSSLMRCWCFIVRYRSLSHDRSLASRSSVSLYICKGKKKQMRFYPFYVLLSPARRLLLLLVLYFLSPNLYPLPCFSFLYFLLPFFHEVRVHIFFSSSHMGWT